MPEKKADSVVQRATGLQQTLAQLLKNPTNGISLLQADMRSLGEVLRRLPKWLAKAGAGHDLRNLAEVAMIRLEPVVGLVQQLPQYGPELTNQVDQLRPQLCMHGK